MKFRYQLSQNCSWVYTVWNLVPSFLQCMVICQVRHKIIGKGIKSPFSKKLQFQRTRYLCTWKWETDGNEKAKVHVKYYFPVIFIYHLFIFQLSIQDSIRRVWSIYTLCVKVDVGGIEEIFRLLHRESFSLLILIKLYTACWDFNSLFYYGIFQWIGDSENACQQRDNVCLHFISAGQPSNDERE